MLEMTVGHLLRGEADKTEVLLGKRDAKTLFAKNIWNGPGGKFEGKEKVLICLARELREEIGVEIDPSSTLHFATVEYHEPYKREFLLTRKVYFFNIRKWEGEPCAMPGQGLSEVDWYPLKDLPYSLMYPDSVLWLPTAILTRYKRILKGNVFYESMDPMKVKRYNFDFEERSKETKIKRSRTKV